MSDLLLGSRLKAFPPSSWGRTVDEVVGDGLALDAFTTPVLTLDERAIAHNLRLMADWTRSRGVELAPHGKTTMAPQLWRRQLDAGAWAITLATAWQLQVARSAGVDRLLLANPLVDPAALSWVRAELAAHPMLRLTCWADSVRTVDLTAKGLAGGTGGRSLDVLVELGAPGGRTGARSVADGLEVAHRIAAAPGLRLAGVGGYEGALAHDRGDAALHRVREYLGAVLLLHQRMREDGLLGATSVLSVGGSAFFDEVVDELTPACDDGTQVVLRSGAYLVHDDGFYAGISPFRGSEGRFRSAMHVWSRVLSRPEPGLALLDAGRRDLAIDEGYPVAQRVRDVPAAVGERWLSGSEVTAVNDQHAFLSLTADDHDVLPVGSVVRLGLSHPCTVLDKWRAIPVVDDADAASPRLLDVVSTVF
jgi:D-serine deaminase-like pyridoxal phosphate-dependent protein